MFLIQQFLPRMRMGFDLVASVAVYLADGVQCPVAGRADQPGAPA